MSVHNEPNMWSVLLKTSFLVCLWNVVLHKTHAQVSPAVHLTVYYEALCPDSRNFVTRSLHRALQTFPELDVKYVAFGKASSNAYGGFDCQHGPDECRGNIVQSCALARLEPGQPQHDFVYCAMMNPREYERCVTKSGLSWTDVDACSQSPEGTEYHRSSEVLTKGNTDGPTFVPSIAINHAFEKSQSTAAFNDLESFLCEQYYVGSSKCSQPVYFFGK